MAHIIFVSPKDNIKFEEVKRIITTISGSYCAFNMYCWCLYCGEDSKTIRNKLSRTGIFKRIAVFALTGYWASDGFDKEMNNWLKNYVEPDDD